MTITLLDPSTSHSIASVRVVQQTSISARDFLSYARVQTQVAKNIIIGFLNPDDNMKPAYVSFKFQRVSERL
jgi:tRNA splicing endonuclease